MANRAFQCCNLCDSRPVFRDRSRIFERGVAICFCSVLQCFCISVPFGKFSVFECWLRLHILILGSCVVTYLSGVNSVGLFIISASSKNEGGGLSFVAILSSISRSYLLYLHLMIEQLNIFLKKALHSYWNHLGKLFLSSHSDLNAHAYNRSSVPQAIARDLYFIIRERFLRYVSNSGFPSFHV